MMEEEMKFTRTIESKNKERARRFFQGPNFDVVDVKVIRSAKPGKYGLYDVILREKGQKTLGRFGRTEKEQKELEEFRREEAQEEARLEREAEKKELEEYGDYRDEGWYYGLQARMGK